MKAESLTTETSQPHVLRTLIVIGVAGAGKTTLGRALANELNATFLDADDFHSSENVTKMRDGLPLTDADRGPWLARLNEELHIRARAGASVVLACSALKADYRAHIGHALQSIHWIFLDGDFATIVERMRARSDHYMPESLLESQFETLERPDNAISIATNLTTAEQVAEVLDSLNSPAHLRAAQ